MTDPPSGGFPKDELDRLHQELMRRAPSSAGAVARFLRDEWVVVIGSAIIGGIVVGLIFGLVFGFDGGKSESFSVDDVAASLARHGLPADTVADFDRIDLDRPTRDVDALALAQLFGDDERVRGLIVDEQRTGPEGTSGVGLQAWVLRSEDDADNWQPGVRGRIGRLRFVRLQEANVVVIVTAERADQARAALADLNG